MSKINHSNNTLFHLVIWAFLPFVGGYFLTAFFNQVNAMLAPYLMHDMHMTSSALGWTTSIYLLVFAIAQLPLGSLLDHYGPRRVQAGLFIIATLGILFFALAQNVWWLLIGRALIGAGTSGGLMSGFKALRMWLPKEKIPLANGVFMASGTFGAVCSTIPVEWALRFISWRHFLCVIAVLTLLISLWIFLSVPEQVQKSLKQLTLRQQLSESKQIYRSSYFWRIAPLVACAFGSNMAIVGLWAGPWFSDVALLQPAQIASHLCVISIALITGILLWGIVADRMMLVFNKPITTVIGLGALLYILVQVTLASGVLPASYLLWIAFGFLSRCVTLAYAAMSQHFHDHYAGRATTALNMLFFVTAFFVQLGMGLVISLWPKDKLGHYPVHAYHVALGIIIAMQIVSYLWFLFYQRSEDGICSPRVIVQ